MKQTTLMLWDLLAPPRRPLSSRRLRRGGEPARAPVQARPVTMRDRYDRLVVEMKNRYGLRVRRWRSSTTGCAWEVYYHDGTITRCIESPYPTGPISCAVFLHEVGHHAIGFRRYKLRCLDEYHAWMWALRTMRERGLNVTPAVERRVHEALCYAIHKARQRGLRRLPAELLPYVERPAPRSRRARRS